MLTLCSNYQFISVITSARSGSNSKSYKPIWMKCSGNITNVPRMSWLNFADVPYLRSASVVLISGGGRKLRLLCGAAELDAGRSFIHFARIPGPNPPLLFPSPGKMSAPVVLRSSGPALCPSFAEVFSFLERYGAALDLPEMTFPQMERYLRDTTTGERSPCVVVAGARKWRKLRHH